MPPSQAHKGRSGGSSKCVWHWRHCLYHRGGKHGYKMMVKNEPLDVMKLFKPLVVSIILCWWYPPADTGMTNSGSSWCVLDFLSYIPNCIGSYTHDLYEAEATQISDKFEEVQQLVYVRDSMYTDLQHRQTWRIRAHQTPT